MKKTRKIDTNKTSHSKLNNNCKTTKIRSREVDFMVNLRFFSFTNKAAWDFKATHKPRPENREFHYNEWQIENDI